MKKLKKIINILILLTGILAFSNSTPTPAGTTIVSDHTQLDYAGNSKIFSMPLTINVAAIYGLDTQPSQNQSTTINSLLPVFFSHKIINNSNTTDNIYLEVKNLAAGWTSEFILDNNGDGIHQPLENTPLSSPITLNQNTSLNIFIKFSHSIISTVNSVLVVSTNHSVSNYLGFNNTWYGGHDYMQVSDNIYTSAPAAAFILEALLQGYYNSETDLMLTANIQVELRISRNIPAATSYNLQLNSKGLSQFQVCTELAGNYYLFISHFNHIKVVSKEKINFSGNLTTVNICNSSSPYFQPIYLSPKAQNVSQNLRTESNGKLTVRGGDYNNDNTINIVDWSAFDYEWKNSGVIADFDGNGIIDTRDYGIWLSNNQDYLPIDQEE